MHEFVPGIFPDALSWKPKTHDDEEEIWTCSAIVQAQKAQGNQEEEGAAGKRTRNQPRGLVRDPLEKTLIA